MTATTYELSDLDKLEAEAVHIFREVAATIEKPALLFSGGKDSVVMLHVAAKAFWPAPLPFPVMHVDTGENFDEVIEFRDRTVERLGVRLIVASVQDDIDAGRVGRGDRAAGQPQPAADRRPCCAGSPRTSSARCSAARGATRRRPAPRSGCSASATSSASGTRATSGPSCGACTTAGTARARTSGSSRCRTGPNSTSGPTSATRSIELPPLYYAHKRQVLERDGMLLAADTRFITARAATSRRSRRRCASAPSATPPAPAASSRTPPHADDVVAEVAAARVTERGATRADDRISEAGMEDRKKEGYF